MFLPTSTTSSSNTLYLIFLMSMCLLPFSTEGGTNSGSVVITFALPFLVFLSVFIGYNFINTTGKIIYPSELKFSILCGFLHTFSILLSSLMNQDLRVAFARSIFHLFGFVIFLYITSNCHPAKNAALAYNKISMIFVLSGFIMSIYFIGNFLLAVQQNSIGQVLLERTKGGLLGLPWGVSNTIAACLMMPLFSALERILNANKNKEVNTAFTLFTIITMIIAIVITQSRNAIISSMIGIILISGLTKNKKLIFSLIITISIILFTVISLYSQELDAIFAARIGDGAEDMEGFNGRTSVWETAILYFSQHPLQPVGYFGMIGEIGHTAHNVFLTTLIDQGILGLFTYLLFLMSNFSFCLKKMFNHYLLPATKRRMAFYVISMLSVLLQLQFEDSNFAVQNIIYQWTFLALMYLSAYCDFHYADSIMPQYALPPAKE
jgi:O-antigen ligase